MYILSQILFVVGAAIILFSYFLKNRKLILAVSISACIMYSLANLFLYAYTAAVLNIISILASVWFYIDAEKRNKKSLVSLISIFAMILATTLVIIICGYEGMISLLATVALGGFIFSIWQENLGIHKWLGLLTATCWIVYQAYYNAIFGIITNIIFIIIDIIAMIKLYRSNKIKKENK